MERRPTYDPYDPLPPPEISERLVVEAPDGYKKVSTEGDRILEPVTADKARLDFLIDQYGAGIVLVQTDTGFDVYAPGGPRSIDTDLQDVE